VRICPCGRVSWASFRLLVKLLQDFSYVLLYYRAHFNEMSIIEVDTMVGEALSISQVGGLSPSVNLSQFHQLIIIRSIY